MGRPRSNLMGQRFGHLTVVGRAGVDEKTGNTFWVVNCECGTERKVIRQDYLTASRSAPRYHLRGCGEPGHQARIDHMRNGKQADKPTREAWEAEQAKRREELRQAETKRRLAERDATRRQRENIQRFGGRSRIAELNAGALAGIDWSAD